jgi:hypothetical protein
MTTCPQSPKGWAVIRYAARFIYWAIKHRSFSSARWIMDFEGKTWK